jgi:hypothetical protein
MTEETPKADKPDKAESHQNRSREKRPSATADQQHHEWKRPADAYEAAARFFSSGIFFMIVGAIFLGIAYFTMTRTHAAMSFVLVVVGVAILLYGTGTQSMGQFDSGQNAEKVARYKVVLAGGAGVLAFCVAAGIIKFSGEMKSAFQIEQKYLRLHISGKGYQSDDIGRYVPDIRINGIAVPAARRGDHIEVYAPYLLSPDPVKFEIRVRLHLVEKAGTLRQVAENVYFVTLKPNGEVDDGAAPGKYVIEAGYDFPRFTLKVPVDLSDDENQRVAGVAPQ